MKQTKKKGFTLVELIIVIAVIGVLAAILIPVFANVIKKANSKSALADARNAVSQYVTESLERRLLANKPIPEQIVLIVEKGGRYYVFGYDTAVSQSIQVSSVNEEGILASGLNDLINTQSWNAHHTEAYDPYTTTTYSVQSDGAFYLVPYTGTTPDNPNVRGFVQSTGVSGNFFRLDKEDQGYGFDLNVGNDTIAFHGCLVNGTYERTSTSSNDSTGSDDTTPPAQASYSVSFTTTGIDSADLANVVYKKGSQVLSNPATLTEGTGVGTLTAECPVATSAYSYTFTGATASNGHSTIDEAGMTITFAFTKVMAQTYNVTYNANGGSGTMTDNTDYLTNAVITLPENAFTAPEHQHFTGWKINNTGELRQAGYQFNITADTEIYAQWADDAQIAVHFNSNGGTGTMADVSVYAGSYTLPECTFTKTHYHFNGWKANNTGATLGATYNVTEEVTFYATWEQDATYTITYNGNGATGGTAPTDANSYYMDESATLLGKGSLAYTHKHFTGWKVENGGALLSAGSSYTVTGNVTMYAQWEDDELFSVEYIQIAGVDSIPSPAKTYYPVGTDSVPINYSGVVINELYERSDWAVGGSPAGIAPTVHQYLENLNTSSVTAGTEITLTPYVVKKGVTVSFISSPSGATGLPGTTSYYYADGLNYTINATPTLGGYDFTGYTLTSSTGVNVALSGEQGRTLTIAKSGSTWTSGTATITANFTASAPVTHTITFTDGDNTDTATATNGVSTSLATLNPLSAPSGKELDKFVIGGTDYAADASYTFTANTTVTVVWKDTPGGSGTNNITLNLKFINSSNGAFYNSSSPITMDVEVANGGTISYTVTQLKQAGKWYTQSGRNYISVTNGTTMNGNTGEITNGGSVLYTVSYTRDDSAETPYDWTLYVAPCRDNVTDEMVYSELAASPNIINPTAIIPVPYEDR